MKYLYTFFTFPILAAMWLFIFFYLLVNIRPVPRHIRLKYLSQVSLWFFLILQEKAYKNIIILVSFCFWCYILRFFIL
jgi:hypothetical protein